MKFYTFLFLFFFLFGCASSHTVQNLTPIHLTRKDSEILLKDYFLLELETKRKRVCQSWMNLNCEHVLSGRTSCFIQKITSPNNQSEIEKCYERFEALCQNSTSKPEFCEPESDGENFYSKDYKFKSN